MGPFDRAGVRGGAAKCQSRAQVSRSTCQLVTSRGLPKFADPRTSSHPMGRSCRTECIRVVPPAESSSRRARAILPTRVLPAGSPGPNSPLTTSYATTSAGRPGVTTHHAPAESARRSTRAPSSTAPSVPATSASSTPRYSRVSPVFHRDADVCDQRKRPAIPFGPTPALPRRALRAPDRRRADCGATALSGRPCRLVG